jgi:hypothetical protein
VEPFVAADDVFAFFRHDDVGRGAELSHWRSRPGALGGIIG